MLVWGWMRRGCGDYTYRHVGGTRGSGIVSSAADVLWMSGMRGVGGVCEMCMCLVRAACWRVDERIGFGLYQSCENSEQWECWTYVCVLGCGGVCGADMGLRPGSGGVGGVM